MSRLDLPALERRRRRLLILQLEVDQELAVIEDVIRTIPGTRPGRPRKPYTMTPDEARAMHGRYNRGERGPEIERGNAEYHRRWRREKRAA